MQALHERFKDRGLVVLAVNWNDDAEIIKRYFEEKKLTISPVRQKESAVRKAYRIQVDPTNYLIDREGKIAAGLIGFDEKKLKAAVEKLFTEK